MDQNTKTSTVLTDNEERRNQELKIMAISTASKLVNLNDADRSEKLIGDAEAIFNFLSK